MLWIQVSCLGKRDWTRKKFLKRCLMEINSLSSTSFILELGTIFSSFGKTSTSYEVFTSFFSFNLMVDHCNISAQQTMSMIGDVTFRS